MPERHGDPCGTETPLSAIDYELKQREKVMEERRNPIGSCWPPRQNKASHPSWQRRSEAISAITAIPDAMKANDTNY